MESKTYAYSGMLLSVIVFFAIGYLSYYPIYVYHISASRYGIAFYGFLKMFSFLKEPYVSKILLLMLVIGSVMAYKPKKKEGSSFKAITYFLTGIGLLFFSDFVITKNPNSYFNSIYLYVSGFFLSVIGAIKIFELLSLKDLSKEDPFNDLNETFLQTEEKIETEHSVNIPYKYRYQGKVRKGWINMVNLFRALMIIGTPGSGKSFALIEEIIEQFINKFFTLLVYDFKFDTLTRIAYNYLKQAEDKYKDDPEKLKLLPKPYFICFDNMEKTHRSNPINPYLMKNQTDATDAASILMKNLNKEWIKRTDFFAKSAISFVSGLIWYLKKKSEEKGKNLCTLPHVIILSTVNVEYLLEIMLKDLEVRSLMIPFKDALEREASQQLSGQTASAQISLSMLSSKEIFYVMSGNDFSLQINDPKKPKLVCIQSNPDRQETYKAPLGLYINKALQVVNQPYKRPLGLIFDELPTIFIMGLRKIIDTGRSNLIATILGIQSISQLFLEYGKEEADVVYDNCANVFCGSAKGETAKRITQLFGKIHQKNTSHNVNKNDTSITYSTQLRELLPISKIASMSTGDFAGIVADTFEDRIDQKLCYGTVLPNLESKKIQGKYEIPIVRNFKKENHDTLVKEILEKIETLNFYDSILELDCDYEDYILFYNDYIVEVAERYYSDVIKRQQFISLSKKLKLYSHLDIIKEYKENDSFTFEEFKKTINTIIDKTIIQENIDKVLDDQFLQIIFDVDDLVKYEYYQAKGKYPEFNIFDEDKIDGEIGNTIKESKELAVNFMKDLNKASSKKLVNMFKTSNDESDSDETTIDTEKDTSDVYKEFKKQNFPEDEEHFSSYDVKFKD